MSFGEMKFSPESSRRSWKEIVLDTTKYLALLASLGMAVPGAKAQMETGATTEIALETTALKEKRLIQQIESRGETIRTKDQIWQRLVIDGLDQMGTRNTVYVGRSETGAEVICLSDDRVWLCDTDKDGQFNLRIMNRSRVVDQGISAGVEDQREAELKFRESQNMDIAMAGSDGIMELISQNADLGRGDIRIVTVEDNPDGLLVRTINTQDMSVTTGSNPQIDARILESMQVSANNIMDTITERVASN